MVNTAPASTTASTVIGFARVSTIGQTLEQQTEALTKTRWEAKLAALAEAEQALAAALST